MHLILPTLDYQIMLTSVAVGLLLISLAMPWLVVNLFGQRSYSALDNMKSVANIQEDEENSSDPPRNDPVLSDLRSVYPNSSLSFVITMVALYPISIITMIAAAITLAALRSNDSKKTTSSLPSNLTLTAGIFAIATGIVWIYSVESFKAQFSHDAELSGGIIGEEWKGQADIFVNRLIILGVGHYLVIAAGVIGIFSYLITSLHDRYKSQTPTAT